MAKSAIENAKAIFDFCEKLINSVNSETQKNG
jgi:hypothetical protein